MKPATDQSSDPEFLVVDGPELSQEEMEGIAELVASMIFETLKATGFTKTEFHRSGKGKTR